MKRTLLHLIALTLILTLSFAVYPSALTNDMVSIDPNIGTQDTLLFYNYRARHHYNRNRSFIKVRIDEIFDQKYFTTSDLKDGFLKARCIVVDDPFGQYLVDDSFTVSFSLSFSLSGCRADPNIDGVPYYRAEIGYIQEFLTSYEYFYISTTPELKRNGVNYFYDEMGRKFTDYDFTNIATIDLSYYYFIPVKDGILDFDGLYDCLTSTRYNLASWDYVASDMDEFWSDRTEAGAIEIMRALYEKNIQ